jgi:hypothetical protein
MGVRLDIEVGRQLPPPRLDLEGLGRLTGMGVATIHEKLALVTGVDHFR